MNLTWSRAIEWSSNTLSLAAAVGILGIVMTRGINSDHSPSAKRLVPGSSIVLDAVDWSANQGTLILALSATCHYCTESAPLYRQLSAALPNGKTVMVAVFPQSTADAQAYLKSIGVAVQHVRQADFSLLGVDGTPTVLIVDRQGRLKAGWSGVLSRRQEDEVFAALGLERERTAMQSAEAPRVSAPGGSGRQAAAEFRALAGDQRVPPIVDIRERDAFAIKHINGAVNIPVDELEVRAVHELPRRQAVFLYCGPSTEVCERTVADGATTRCTLAEHILMQRGFADVRRLTGDLEELTYLAWTSSKYPMPGDSAASE